MLKFVHVFSVPLPAVALKSLVCPRCWGLTVALGASSRKLYSQYDGGGGGEEGGGEGGGGGGRGGEGELEAFRGPIPKDKLSMGFSRSSGPGGQNVNKLNTKAEVRFHVDSADWLPERVKHRLKVLCKTRINRVGELIMTSQRHRSQHKNLEEAIEKLELLVEKAGELPRAPSRSTIARVRMLKHRAKQERMADKKYHSRKKADRTDT